MSEWHAPELGCPSHDVEGNPIVNSRGEPIPDRTALLLAIDRLCPNPAMLRLIVDHLTTQEFVSHKIGNKQRLKGKS